MKKFTAILFIVILTFNWYGYRIVTSILTQKADQELEAKLDKQEYDESQLLEVRIAMNVPYLLDQVEFERQHGEAEVDGMYYTYVKRKIENGYLILKCIPNSDKAKIKAANSDFFKMANGLEGNQSDKKQSNTNNFAKNFWSKYDARPTGYTIEVITATLNKKFLNIFSISLLTDTYTSKPAQPPENTVYSIG